MVYFNAGLLAESQHAPSRSCDPPTCSSFTVAFLGPKQNADLVVIIHAPLHVSHAAPTANNVTFFAKAQSSLGPIKISR
jgi:hypothetical protein